MAEQFAPALSSVSVATERPRAFETILYGGLAVGVLDGLYAVIASGLRGVSPARVFRYVASGLLGRAAFSGGMRTALFGVLLHFVVAFLVATVFYAASRALLPVLIKRAVLCGLLYGALAQCVMKFIVVPLSAAPPLPSTAMGFVSNLIGHALLVGLPVALVARWSSRQRA